MFRFRYRTREEIQEMRQTRDPITSLREKLVSSQLAEADELKKIELDVRKQVKCQTPFFKVIPK